MIRFLNFFFERPAARGIALVIAGVSAGLPASPLRADEGMWLYSAPPRAALQAKYGFTLTDAWLDHLMKASVRFNSGGSGSWVSGDGLVITNHHVGADELQKLGDEQHNYLRDGFYAASLAEERKCVDLELNVLQTIEDVTARVNAAVPTSAEGETAVLARRKITAEIEKESLAQTGLRSDVVTLYQGGAYHLYRFKKYTDIRLVFAPEQAIAFFGGDPDNFEYPRHDLDICFFRVYENGQPVRPAHFLTWSTDGAQEGQLTFVSGHPGSTRRLLTVPELRHIRDHQLPKSLAELKRREVLLVNWSARSSENARRAKEDLFGIQNSRKLLDGELAALQDPAFFGAKVTAESEFKKRLTNRADHSGALPAFVQIEEAQQASAVSAREYNLLEGGAAFNCDSFALARTLLRAGEERPKANGERLREYTDARRESFEQRLFSEKPIYADLEILTLADSLAALVDFYGADHPRVQRVLAGKSPRGRAAELITTTQVRTMAFRRQLYEGGAAVVAAAKDPLIALAQAIDPDARALRKIVENAGETKKKAHAIIGKARFALDGPNQYPDATFTLRLSYGVVKGYSENGQKIPAMTTFADLFKRSAQQENKDPFALPERWRNRQAAIALTTPFNFVCTADIIGGNSGSPTVNEKGEFTGIIFDGNLPSLSADFGYEEHQSRAVSVHSAGIIEALRNVYQVEALAQELLQGKRP